MAFKTLSLSPFGTCKCVNDNDKHYHDKTKCYQFICISCTMQFTGQNSIKLEL